MISIIHIDDDLIFADHLRGALESPEVGKERYMVESTQDPQAYWQALEAKSFDIAIIDVHIDHKHSTTNGRDLIAKTHSLRPDILILMCSSSLDPKVVSSCLRSGAYDFITKTANTKDLTLRIKLAHDHFTQSRAHFKNPNAMQAEFAGKMIHDIAARIPRLIDSAVTAIYVQGPSGTGKEVVASLFEKALPRDIPFVKINCGAIAPTLLEAELFGYKKGAFTGATIDKRGILESAHGGFVFLDEIATLSERAQVAMLRVLENKTLRRVGDTQDRPADVRIISATNESLASLVSKGRFRQDLWQRLCEVIIELKPLRQRMDEIDPLIDHFLGLMKGGPYTLEPAARALLRAYDWHQGNIRELRNCLRAMTEFSMDRRLTALSIPARVLDGMQPKASGKPPHSLSGHQTSLGQEDGSRLDFEEEHLILPWPQQGGAQVPTFEQLHDELLAAIIRKVHSQQGQISMRQLAKLLDISRSTLSTKIKQLSKAEILSEDEMNDIFGSKKSA